MSERINDAIRRGSRNFPCTHSVIRFFQNMFSSLQFQDIIPTREKAHSESCKPKTPRIHNSSSALIVTKVTWHNRPPAPARTALWESWVPCGSRHATGPVTLLGERRACEWAHAHILIFPPSWQVKDRAHFFLSQIQSGFKYAYMYSFICSVAHDIFLQRSEPLILLGNRMKTNATRLRARDWDFTCLLQKYECSFPE